MGISSALQWWDEWHLRTLVLSSLGIQFFLAIFAAGRKFGIPPWSRFLIWLSYLGSDALAIYALATLFNRQKKLQRYNSEHGSRDLEVLWAPILLMHLGGQVFITAYNMEDNELWKRHVVTALSQITVAIYVFCKSWSSSADRRLLAAAILLFIIGIARCLEKPLALKGASFYSLSSSSDPAQRTLATNREKELESYVQQAMDFIQTNHDQRAGHTERIPFSSKLFVDIPYSYSDRLANLKSFWVLDDRAAYESLQIWLSSIFDILYTKVPTENPVTGTWCCVVFTWIVSILLSVVAISLFHVSHKKAYSSSDIIVTFILLYGILVLEIISVYVLNVSGQNWPDLVPQHSLIGFFAQDKRQTRLKHTGRCVSWCKGLFEKVHEPCHSAPDITMLVRGYVQNGWREYIEDAESYRKFSDTRGQWKLEREGCDESLGWSLEKPFDESVLVWHMATDFCFHTSPQCHSKQGIEISNYMMHLLFANPEMLMPSSRLNLYRTAYNELEAILEGGDTASQDDKEHFMQEIIDRVKSEEGAKGSFIHDAWMLAEGLMGLGNSSKMWEVIEGVWVEMLCFSAGRCRGYLHAKSLGSGGEYLSFVWLLLACMGMETFADKLQRTQKLQLLKKKKHRQSEAKDDAAPSPSQGMELRKLEDDPPPPRVAEDTKFRTEEETASAPSSSQGEDCVPELNEIVVSPQ